MLGVQLALAVSVLILVLLVLSVLDEGCCYW